ncbi:hypothetical protein BS329_15395 [Amycolatopsis coloradensis]|uniref:Uncharacterized protein n=1 Tax=Amycolatopsis coloradensis TaxID=76021 RepID=A0A1R0KU46_9PSEU|nr:hypothetical protein [Amycolatopsis coloradensis]OLZ51649.1 hypothetical protein BS329_15395 [Amycolatopsis coloradensis]
MTNNTTISTTRGGHRTLAALALGAIAVGGILATAGTASASTAPAAPASYLHSVGTDSRELSVTPDSRELSITPDSRELSVTPVSRELSITADGAAPDGTRIWSTVDGNFDPFGSGTASSVELGIGTLNA